MSLARAFTTRRGKNLSISSPLPQRSSTMKGSIRNKISAPVELLSTTNMLSYNAPDLYPSSSASLSGDESDSVPSLVHSPGASSSAASSTVDSLPNSPEPNHLSCYFGKDVRGSTSSNEDAPKIPQRALSHTKRTHEIVHHQRSVSRNSSMRKTNPMTAFTRDSINMFSSNPEMAEEPAHPFGSELAQVTELAEDFGVRDQMQVVDAEEQFLIARGLRKFQAQDYVDEIQGLFFDTYGIDGKPTSMWI